MPKQVLFHRSSVKVKEDRTVIAAPIGKGIWRMGPEGEWTVLTQGLPKNVHVNRLQKGETDLYACTAQGLFRLGEDGGQSLDIPLVCYQFKELGDLAFVATSRGLWSRTGRGWINVASAQAAVYDFLYLPEYLFLALDGGIAMYDRMACTWAQLPVGARVTGLGVFRSRLIGVTEQGELALGDRRGGFEKVRFPGLFLFNVISTDGSVFLCADRGLYRLGEVGGRPVLFSLSLGTPITDLDIGGGRAYAATLNEGVRIWDGFRSDKMTEN
ncbi:hypothetical protein [Cohnella zeiphila]|uniref:Uncharacterized protein n=1 Tax=Cohnella zeiphila TaxID=2761120 RepID=A0A7X0SL07_9BACL|nr:hypothetical protein [Cohnella zeiphila]MBB6731839.1 hypothetical protein [Cohnella zeiphila]